MKKSLITGAVTLLLIVFLTNQTQAQEDKKWVSGNSVNVAFPIGKFNI